MRKGFIVLAAMLGMVGTPLTAQAARCYDHNGSLMRVDTGGGRFSITYVRPKSSLRAAGVRSGTLLIDGTYRAHDWRGTARRFSKFCPGQPLTYPVSSWVEGEGPLVLEGTRQIYSRCQSTGRTAHDRLVFHYQGEC